MRASGRVIAVVTLLVAAIVIVPVPAHALTTMSVAVVKTDTAEGTRNYVTGSYLNGSGYYETRVNNLVDLLGREFSDVVTIGDAELASLSALERYDVIVFPRTLALTSAQRAAVLKYVTRGGGAVGLFGFSRWAQDADSTYGYTPFLGMSEAPGVYLWPPSSNQLKVWEWGEVSELIGLWFFNDPLMYSSWQAVGKPTSTHWILDQTAEDVGRTEVSLKVEAADYNETMLSLPGAIGVTPLMTYGTKANSDSRDDVLDSTAAAAAHEYYSGRFVYYGFQLYDVASGWLKSDPADQLMAGRLLVNSVKWAASAEGFVDNAKQVSLTGEGWTSKGILWVRPTITNSGGISLLGPMRIGVYTPSGAVFGSYQAYAPHNVPLPPGASYTHDSFQVPVGSSPQAGTWRVRLTYRYWDYLQGGVVEAYRDMSFSSDGTSLRLASLGPVIRPGDPPPPSNAHLSQPFVPANLSVNKPFTVTGFVDKAAATGPIKLLFYQNIGGRWVLQKTVYARWSGYTDTVTKYLADVTVPYEGTWRIGASYGGNETYASSYMYRDITVGPKSSANLSTPYVPADVRRGSAFGVTGFVDQAAASGPIKLLFYQNIGGRWVLQKIVYAKWSGYTDTVTKYLADIVLPYQGTWRIGASYGGNSVYAAAYMYRDITVGAAR
ncbi:MAG: hypothetical protein RBS17_01335 [Coriobacteriia bacterium]|nr:hypothetical protein [Coriobacteriia bacterium]